MRPASGRPGSGSCPGPLAGATPPAPRPPVVAANPLGAPADGMREQISLITGRPQVKGAGEVGGESAPDYRYLVVPLRALAST